MDEKSFANTFSRYRRHDESIDRLSSVLGPDAMRAVVAELCGTRSALKLERDCPFAVSKSFRTSRESVLAILG